MEKSDTKCHPGSLDPGSIRKPLPFGRDDRKRITRRLDEPDVFVITNVFWRRAVADSSYNDFILEIQRTGKPVIVVTNNHYPYTCRDKFDAVLLSYNIGPEGMAETARLLFGEQ